MIPREMTYLLELWSHAWVQALAITALSLLVALIVERILFRAIRYYTRRTKTDLDDQLAQILRRPIILSVVFGGLAIASHRLSWQAGSLIIFDRCLLTLAVFVWGGALSRSGSMVLARLAERKTDFGIIQVRTLPFFDILLKTGLFLAVTYGVMVTWGIDIAGWLASAGIAGIVLGLAAKDSLANLFAGIFILADAPFQVGDWILIDTGTRGRVSDIGFRSTRLITPDGIEVTVPNSVIGNATLINESGGPSASIRVCATVEVAYDTNLDTALKTLRTAAQSVESIAAKPEPNVVFTEFGASGLVMQTYVWVDDPSLKIPTQHALNMAIYDALVAAEISIPFPQQDLHIKELPAIREGLAESRATS